MNTSKNAMIQSLENAKNELKRKQEGIKRNVNSEMNNSCFERNMITDLLYMIELKEKIKTLELYVQMEG